ncbi:hypothetical protein LMG23994_06122 [Cupriavidus pinatubonensis]|uniref:Uncharacterized protein n=1 Tax=Cupriavidus pinatubonensis TaxID=248026 RepID=A0ABM8Y0L0_9BURK|nr:hypothetical protein LMG23994_06122 [Cupriavidus pinatubonensis]
MTHYPAFILLESTLGARGRSRYRLDCDSVTVAPGGLVVEGVEVRRLLAISWAPEYVSFAAWGERHRYKVGPVAVVRPRRALFPFS